MLGADSNASLTILVQRPVVDGHHITKLQVRRDLVDAIERRLIKDRLINLPLDQYKLLVVQVYQFFRSMIDEAHWHCIQQFVGKMNSHEWLRPVWPFNLIAKHLKPPALLFF